MRGADVVVLATTAREPVIRRDWLGPGAHVNAVGASVRSDRELDVETVAASALFCDSRESFRNEAGEYRLALEQGAIYRRESRPWRARGDTGGHGARSPRAPSELTVFRSLGLAVEDLAAAECAVERARRMGIGDRGGSVIRPGTSSR